MNEKTRKYPKLKACETVGELIEQLQRLPATMNLDPYSEEGILPVVFNVGKDSEHVQLMENDGTWDDEQEEDEQ